MKYINHLIVYTAIIFAVSSCGYFNEESSSDDSNDLKKIVELPSEVRDKIVKQDSLMTDIVNKLDTLTNVLNETKNENAELKKKIETLESPKNKWAYITLGAILLAILSFFVALFKSRESRIKRIVKQYLDKSERINGLLNNVNSLLLQHNNISTTKVSTRDIENEIKLLKMQMKQVVSDINAINYTSKKQNDIKVHQESHKPMNDPQYQKAGYAKVDQDMYFTTIFDSNQEGCVFKITFTNPNKGKFNIISLDKIQSRNDWQKKVECSGISIKDATDFRVEEDGICEKIDENTWEVKKPLKIRLLK